MRWLPLFAVMSSIPSFSLAQSCWVVSTQRAASAIQFLQVSRFVTKYCAGCGDSRAVRVPIRRLGARVFDAHAPLGVPVTAVGDVDAAHFHSDPDARLEIVLNGRPVDFADLYDSDGNNLGERIGCENTSPRTLPKSVEIVDLP